MGLVIILILVVSLPIAWLASEFQANRPVRISLGVAAIATSYLVAWGAGSLDRWNSNVWYGTASEDLITNTIDELQDGNIDTVVAELQVLRDKLEPTYETRADYDRLVAEYVYAISDSPTLQERNDPRWANNVPESHAEWAAKKKAEQ